MTLSHELQNGIAWFLEYLPQKGVYIIHEDHREPVHIFINACNSGACTLCQADVYHTQFPQSVWELAASPYAQLNFEVLSAVVAI